VFLKFPRFPGEKQELVIQQQAAGAFIQCYGKVRLTLLTCRLSCISTYCKSNLCYCF